MCRISTFLFILFFACVCQPVFSQQKLIALHHAGEATFFTSLTEAYNATVNGDTLYIPGGVYEGLSLYKSLAIIGVGHHSDSTAATGPTILPNLNFYGGSDNSYITGIRLNAIMYCEGIVSNVIISRCYLNQGMVAQSGAVTNWTFFENFIGLGTYYPGGYYSFGPGSIFSTPWWYAPSLISNFVLVNNVFQGSVSCQTCEISNNIFQPGANLETSSSSIRNNVFVENSVNNSSSSQWHNNLNTGVNGGPDGNNNTGSGNYLNNVPLESVFVNFAGGNTFYHNDFHVINPAYIGDDGAPVGIYGGPFPWKEGSLPFNPHISSKVIDSVTNPDGTLHINVDVKAQQN